MKMDLSRSRPELPQKLLASYNILRVIQLVELVLEVSFTTLAFAVQGYWYTSWMKGEVEIAGKTGA